MNKEEYEIIFVPNEGRAILNKKTKKIYWSEFQIINEKNEEIKELQQENQQLKKQKNDVVEYIKEQISCIHDEEILDDLLRMLGEIDVED